MAPLQVDYSEAETRKLISDLGTSKGDKFRIRVLRRGNGGAPEVIATFEEARMEHVAAPERWLPDLAGGGNYVLHVMHDSSGMETVGGGIPVRIEHLPPRRVDPRVVQSMDWWGPTSLTFPKLGQQGQPLGTTVNGGGIDIESVGASTPVGARVLNGNDAQGWDRAQQFERQLIEVKKQQEVENIRRDFQQREQMLAQTVNDLKSEIRSLRDAKPHESVMDSLGKALTPLVPVLQELMRGNNEIRVKMMEQTLKTSEMQLAQQREESAKFEKLLTAITQRPTGIDPTVQLVLEHLKSQANGSPVGAVMSEMFSSFSGLMQTNLRVMTGMMDSGLLGGDRDSKGEIVREIAQAAGSFFEMIAAKTQQAQQQQPQRPAGYIPAGQAMVPQQQLPQRRPPAITVLDTMIRNHHDAAQTANFFLNAVSQEADLQKQFESAGNDIEKFFEAKWGPWALSNVQAHGPYLLSLREAVLAQAKARGWEMAAEGGGQPQPQAQPAARPPNGGPVQAAPRPGFAGHEPVDPNEEDEDEEEEEAGEGDPDA